MSFDLASLDAMVQAHGRLVRVVIAATRGSTPRETGASMLVWKGGSHGTIGGGALEYQSLIAARSLLEKPGEWCRDMRTVPLGAALGQCCGGSVTLLDEVFDRAACDTLSDLSDSAAAFGRATFSGPQPFAANAATPGLDDGRMIEGFAPEPPEIWIYGAGHVGRALVDILPPLGFKITWVDTEPARFPAAEPGAETPGVNRLVAQNPADVVRYAPAHARHLVLTYSHALDLEICHRILSHGFHAAGLIGSSTKWARFRTRLAKLGHSEAQINRIECPIGLPELGKTPAAVALGVASALVRETRAGSARQFPNDFAI